MMSARSLRVENFSSRCTTPSEWHEPTLVSVKVGCLHINPATARGLRTLLIHMLVLCFIPHVALVAQNCTIMAQLSHALDSSLFLHNKVYTALALGDAVVAVQRERVFMSRYLFDVTSREDIDLSALKQTFESTDSILEELPQAMGRDNDWLSLYYEDTALQPLENISSLALNNTFDLLSYTQKSHRYMEKLVKVKTAYWDLIR
ncbi:unnamed protein product [Chilo suppressalis]|uniref:Prolyl 4-hydroxylase alpha-subunit N-terminal domain-containing protein n=1 Tax=Chilo suppressalis TaxID=168631 RepID=A0ABN8L4B5_CHISP|nr:unnamed protein product [Chilo suppressalis]